MEARELRIGNYVYLTLDIFKSIHEIQGKDILMLQEYTMPKEALVESIKLTEEWLLKFGFGKDDDFGNWHLTDYEIYSIKNGWHRSAVCGIKDNKVYWYFGASDDYYSWTQELKHVHQLQNLYFALTNTELKIKEQ